MSRAFSPTSDRAGPNHSLVRPCPARQSSFGGGRRIGRDGRCLMSTERRGRCQSIARSGALLSHKDAEVILTINLVHRAKCRAGVEKSSNILCQGTQGPRDGHRTESHKAILNVDTGRIHALARMKVGQSGAKLSAEDATQSRPLASRAGKP